MQTWGFAYLGAGRLDEAIASFRTVLRLAPEFAAAHYAIGVALLTEGRGAGRVDGDAEGTRGDAGACSG